MPTLTMTVDDTSPVLQWSPTTDWRPGGADPFITRYYQSSCMATNVTGASVSFAFFGTNVQIYGSKRADHGSFQVQIDNTTYNPMDGISTEEPGKFQERLFSVDGLENGEHVVKVTNQGTGTTPYFDLDFVTWETDIGKFNEQLTVQTVQDTNQAIVWDPPSGAWQDNPENVGMYFGSTGRVSTRPGSGMQYEFTGSAISLFGTVGPKGAPYSVKLDDRPVQKYSSFGSRFIPQSLLYYAGGLSDGAHVIKVTNEAWQAAPGAGQELSIDFINLYTTPSIEVRSIDRLPARTIAGITVGTIAGLILFLVLISFHIRRRRPVREQRRQKNSRSGLFKILSGWGSNSLMARIKKKGRTRSSQPFDIDGVDYARVGGSERETAYLIPEYGPPGTGSGGGGGGGGGGNVGTDAGGARGLSAQRSALSGSSRTPSHSTGRSHPGQESASGMSVLNQPAVEPLTALEMGIAGPSHQRAGTSDLVSSTQGASVVFGGSTADASSSSQSGSSTSGSSRGYSRPRTTTNLPSPLGARPISSYSPLQLQPEPRIQTRPQQSPPQSRSPQLQRTPTILSSLPPGAARPVPQTELASTELGELNRVGGSVVKKSPPEYDNSDPQRLPVGDKKGTLR